MKPEKRLYAEQKFSLNSDKPNLEDELVAWADKHYKWARGEGPYPSIYGIVRAVKESGLLEKL